jgi:hypothetical protein
MSNTKYRRSKLSGVGHGTCRRKQLFTEAFPDLLALNFCDLVSCSRAYEGRSNERRLLSYPRPILGCRAVVEEEVVSCSKVHVVISGTLFKDAHR